MARHAAAAGAALVCWLTVGCLGQAPAEGIEQAADVLLSALHERGLFDGAVVLGRGEREVYARGFGFANVEAGVPFTPDTPADGGSIAKTLTAASILMLREEGRLRLDDPVRRHLPGYPHPPTTVRHLLAHSAGLPGYEFFDDLVAPDRVRTTALFLEILRERAVDPAFEPGTRFRYDNLAYDVAALLVERLTGEPWSAFLARRVFGPLEMEATFLRPARFADWPGVRTLSYRRIEGRLTLYDVWDNEGFYGGSNLYFSARDLHRWGRSFYTRPVLGRAALAIGRVPAVVGAPGLGGPIGVDLLSWYYAPEGRRYHYPGSIRGFWSCAYRDEGRRYSVVYTSNSDMPQWLRPLLTRALIDVMEGREPGPLEPPAVAELVPERWGAVAGAYSVPGLGTVTFAEREGEASIRVGSGVEYPAYPVGGGLLYVPGLDVWFGFDDPPAGSPPNLVWLSVFRVGEGKPASRAAGLRPTPRRVPPAPLEAAHWSPDGPRSF